VKAELARLKGDWVVVSLERDGKADASMVGAIRTQSEQEYTLTPKTGAKVSGTKSINPTAKLKTFDMKPTSGKYKDKTLLGIYQLDGDKLTMCFAEPGQERPTEFASKAGLVLVVHERKK
jgi:uncharacterized protein (TIGR03067 family)